jgi:peptide chain release factor 2
LKRLSGAEDSPPGELVRQYNFLTRELPRVELTALLTGPHDMLGAYVHIRARGRPEAVRRWVRELAHMYLGWARQRGFAATALGEELETARRGAARPVTVGVTLAISGYGVYGLLKGEAGLHRAVLAGANGGKDEPPQKLTAQVKVWPELADDRLPAGGPASAETQIETAAQPADQSGVFFKRLTARATATHRPSGRQLSLLGELPAEDLAHECARLLWIQLNVGQGAPAANGAETEAGSAGDGLVRTYQRHKERGVRDHRTGLRVGNVKKVLDGGLDVFIEAAMQARHAAPAAPA